MNLIQSIFNNRKNTDNKTIKTYLDKLDFQHKFKTINVVGTNGKGSVSHYLTQNLRPTLKIGTFTSPHIFEANERIKINGENIPTNVLEEYIQKYIGEELHFFAIMFLCALEYFNDQKCDVVILEAGIGGTHDPSNLINGDIGVLTSIGYDHMELFGDTLEDVLNDKIGIMNKGMNFYSGTELEEMNQTIAKVAKSKEATHLIIENNANDYKKRNQLLVAAILKNEFNVTATFTEPLGRASIQNINGYKAILDVAHNQDGIIATLEYLKSENITFEQVVITISKRKDYSKLNKIFENKKIYVYELNDTFINSSDINAKRVENLKEFYNHQQKNTLYIGSFYSIGEILKNDKTNN